MLVRKAISTSISTAGLRIPTVYKPNNSKRVFDYVNNYISNLANVSVIPKIDFHWNISSRNLFSMEAQNSTSASQFRLQVCSDIHTEFYPGSRFKDLDELIDPLAPYLALVGDIGVIGPDQKFENFKNFVFAKAEQFEKVLLVLGNHEYYGGEYHEVQEKVKKMCEAKPNVLLLQKSSVTLDGVVVLGTTLWSHVPPEAEKEVGQALNDYVCIKVKGKRLTVHQTNEWFQDEKNWLKKEIASAKAQDQQVVVLTHHSPIKDGSDPIYPLSGVNHAFCTDLEELMGGPVKYWIYGHTHYCQRVVRKGTTVIANARGYPHESQGRQKYDSKLVITV